MSNGTLTMLAGETVYATADGLETSGKDMSQAQYGCALSTYSNIEPTIWNSPDDVDTSNPSKPVVKMKLSGLAAGTYWFWVKVSDTPEVLISCVGRVIVRP